MWGDWDQFEFRLHKVLCIVLTLHFLRDECLSLNLEGNALLKFRSRVEVDPYGAMENWDPRDSDPCSWTGVRCIEGNVVLLNLENLSLRGSLAPEIGQLKQLRALFLCNNKFFGGIPENFGHLSLLAILDLRNNNLSGTIPTQIGEMQSLRRLLLCNNKLEKPNIRFDIESDLDRACDTDIESMNFNEEMQERFRADLSTKENGIQGENLAVGIKDLYRVRNGDVRITKRRLLDTSNIAAVPSSITTPPTISPVPSSGSGSFSAFKRAISLAPSPAPADPPILAVTPPPTPSRTPFGFDPRPANSDPSKRWSRLFFVVALPVVALLLTVVACAILVSRSKGVPKIGPWKTGLSGQLQKAFITGVPKLNREELVGACEDFSNIVTSYPNFTVYKGTLSSGVEIAVVSTVVSSAKDWSKRSESRFRKKIDLLSRINHKNFVNLLGYCEEEEPFMRMMVLEYAPNGTLYEHLHVEEFEPIDWTARMRITMGIAYCLQHMHDLNPPISHLDLQSTSILLSEDYAAKIVDVSVWKEVISKQRPSRDESDDARESHSAGPAGNVYSFGIILLEIISGKLPYSPDDGSLVNLALECMNEGRSMSSLIDPSLKSHKEKELQVICEVIEDCIHQDLKKRPRMKEITNKLRGVLAISPEAATPRLSPLWWAELEILSVEAT